MARLEPQRVAAFCLVGATGLSAWCGVARTACASPEPSLGADPNADAQKPPLGRLEVALIGDVEQDPVLFERIRSLFPPQTAVVLRTDDHIDQRAVLLPQRADTVYIWIRVTERTRARVYLALSEGGERARYLFREVRLDAGLDEVGGETLAEVAHSSAQALWLRELQTSRPAVVAALERELEPPRGAPAKTAGGPIAAASSGAPQDSPDSRQTSAAARGEDHSLRLGLGMSETAHTSGAEGWLHEPGGFLTFEYRARISLRVAVRYLVPTEFDLPPARVHLSGASGEFRGGWLSNDARRMRLRIEAGVGVLLGHARASIIADQPEAHAFAGQEFERVYSLAAAAFEWPLGPAWIAAGVDLRVPLRTTSYEVGGQSGASTSSALCPGGSLELGIGFEPVMR